jgi:hypothetical protein
MTQSKTSLPDWPNFTFNMMSLLSGKKIKLKLILLKKDKNKIKYHKLIQIKLHWNI